MLEDLNLNAPKTDLKFDPEKIAEIFLYVTDITKQMTEKWTKENNYLVKVILGGVILDMLGAIKDAMTLFTKEDEAREDTIARITEVAKMIIEYKDSIPESEIHKANRNLDGRIIIQ